MHSNLYSINSLESVLGQALLVVRWARIFATSAFRQQIQKFLGKRVVWSSRLFTTFSYRRSVVQARRCDARAVVNDRVPEVCKTFDTHSVHISFSLLYFNTNLPFSKALMNSVGKLIY